jgi:hypothetical protein
VGCEYEFVVDTCRVGHGCVAAHVRAV